MKKKRYVVDYRDTLFKYRPKTIHFTYTSPDQYLELAGRRLFKRPDGTFIERYDPESVADLVKKMEKGTRLDPPYLEVDGEKCRVIQHGHEGRHRAVAAKQVGIDKIPVLMFCKRGDCEHCFKDWRKTLKPPEIRW